MTAELSTQCPACVGAGNGEPATVHRDVPVLTQYASGELIEHFVAGTRAPASDPRWPEFGAPSASDYAFWARRACGPTCLRMVLLHLLGAAPTTYDIVTKCVAAGAFVVDGNDVGGIYYAPFVDYMRAEFALDADVAAELPVPELVDQLGTGVLAIVSVNSAIRYSEIDSPARRGGHLVLARGVDDASIHVNNPSGHTPQSRNAVIDRDRFARFYAGRGILVRPPRLQ